MGRRGNRAPFAEVTERRTLAVLAASLAFVAALVFVPCGISLVVASWFALLTRPVATRLARKLRGRTKAAAVVTSIVVIGVLGPVVVALVPVVSSAVELASEVGRSRGQWREAARSIIGDGAGQVDWMRLFREHVSSAWEAASMVLNTSASVLFGVAMFVVGLFSFSASGERLVAWLKVHSPMKPEHFDRMGAAYAETGRGLLVGVGATALIQGAIATLTYAVVGIPRALALGLLTTVGALIPGVGTLLVWGPVALILGLGGYPGKAVAVVVSGVVIIGSVDNFLKPILSTWARLSLPPVLVFITMLSGLVAFGPAGLFLGPLVVRLAIEALEIAREERLLGSGPEPVGASAPIDTPASTRRSLTSDSVRTGWFG